MKATPRRAIWLSVSLPMNRKTRNGVILVCVAALVGCGAERASSSPPDASLLAALGTAQALQHRADELEDTGEIARAVVEARRVLDVPFPAGAAEREDVRLDAHGRIAELELARGALEAADAALDAGLSEATRDSYFRARLRVVRGRVLRARAAALRASGDEAGARTASEAALVALEESIAENQRVLASMGVRPDGGT